MTQYYVADADGSNTYNGLYPAFVSGLNGPWKTVDYAVAHVTAGDFVDVRTGTYGAVTIGPGDGGGSAGLPITIRKYQSEVVTIDGGASRAVYCNAAKNYYTWDGLNFDSDNALVIACDDWNRAYGGNNFWIIQNCTILGPVEWYGHDWQFLYNTVNGAAHPTNLNGVTARSGSGGVSGDLAYNNLIHGNVIHDFQDRGIWLQNLPHNDIVTNNIVYNITVTTNGMGIDADGYTTCQYGHTISGNTIHNCATYGIEVENTCFSTIENNTIYACGTGSVGAGIHVMAYSTGVVHDGYGATNFLGYDAQLIVRQNLVYDNIVNGIQNAHADGVLIKGNTVAYNGTFGVRFDGVAGENDVCDFVGNILAQNCATSGEAEVAFSAVANSLGADDCNLFYERVKCYCLDASPWTTYTLPQYRTLTGKAANSLSAPPFFVDVAADNYHLQAISPAKDKGIDIGTSTDLDGHVRRQGAAVDIGAFEYEIVWKHGYKNILGEERITVPLSQTGNTVLDAIFADWFFGSKIYVDSANAGSVRYGTGVGQYVPSGGTVYTDAGNAAAAGFAAGSDVRAFGDTAIAVAPMVAVGDGPVVKADAGIAATTLAGTGADALARADAGTAATAGFASGVDEVGGGTTYTDIGTVVSVLSATGTALVAFGDTGIAGTPAVATGTDAVIRSDSAIAIAIGVATGTGPVTFGDSTVAAIVLFGSGIAANVYSDTTVAVTVLETAGYDAVTRTDTTRAAGARFGSGVDEVGTGITFTDMGSARTTLSATVSEWVTRTDTGIAAGAMSAAGTDGIARGDMGTAVSIARASGLDAGWFDDVGTATTELSAIGAHTVEWVDTSGGVLVGVATGQDSWTGTDSGGGKSELRSWCLETLIPRPIYIYWHVSDVDVVTWTVSPLTTTWTTLVGVVAWQVAAYVTGWTVSPLETMWQTQEVMGEDI